jgi:hypothetical protein
LAERLGMSRHQFDEVMPAAELADWAALDTLRHQEREKALRRQRGKHR